MNDDDADDICQQTIKQNERWPKLDNGQEGNLTEAMNILNFSRCNLFTA